MRCPAARSAGPLKYSDPEMCGCHSWPVLLGVVVTYLTEVYEFRASETLSYGHRRKGAVVTISFGGEREQLTNQDLRSGETTR